MFGWSRSNDISYTSCVSKHASHQLVPHDHYPKTCTSRLCPLHSVYRPTIAPRRSRFRATSWYSKPKPERSHMVRVKAVHRNVVCQAMSQRILIRPSQLLITPRLFCQRTVPAFTYHKLQSSTPHQTRTMSDIKQISSQRAAQRELDLMFWSLLLSLMVFS